MYLKGQNALTSGYWFKNRIGPLCFTSQPFLGGSGVDEQKLVKFNINNKIPTDECISPRGKEGSETSVCPWSPGYYAAKPGFKSRSGARCTVPRACWPARAYLLSVFKRPNRALLPLLLSINNCLPTELETVSGWVLQPAKPGCRMHFWTAGQVELLGRPWGPFAVPLKSPRLSPKWGLWRWLFLGAKAVSMMMKCQHIPRPGGGGPWTTDGGQEPALQPALLPPALCQPPSRQLRWVPSNCWSSTGTALRVGSCVGDGFPTLTCFRNK